jgi:hypothetical protein
MLDYARKEESDYPDPLVGNETVRASLTHSPNDAGADVTDPGIDPLTSQTLHLLFPPSRTAWETFLSGLLRHAIIAPPEAFVHVISFPLEEERKGDVAVACFTSICDLSCKLRLAYETTHLYYIFLKAIGLIYTCEQVEQRHKRLFIILPLAPYHLPRALPERLEQLKARYGRHQVRQLVEQVSEHLSHAAGQETVSYPDTKPEFGVSGLYASIQQILSSEGVADADGRIVTRITEETLCFMKRDTGDSLVRTSVDETGHQLSSSRDDHAVDQAGAELASEPSRALAQDSVLSIRQPQKVEAFANAPSSLASRIFQDSCLRLSEESQHPLQRNNTDATIQEADTLPPTNLLTGEASLDSVSLLSINGIGDIFSVISPPDSDQTDTLTALQKSQEIAKIPSPVRMLSTRAIRDQAIALAALIEGKVDNFPAFITLLKKYDSQIVSAAIVATLVRKHFPGGMGPLKKPGGYCTRRCQEYAQTAIPDEVMALLHAHESFSYQEIDGLLSQQAQEQKARSSSALSLIPSESLADDAQGLPAPKRGTWMDRQTAEVLAARIPLDAPSAEVAGIRDVRRGEVVISVVDASVEGVPWTIPSLEDWLDHIVAIRELEASLAQSGNRSVGGSREHPAKFPLEPSETFSR